jgi:putative hydrolase of the HAD superfamily
MMKVRGVLFDLDETLIEEEASNDASALVACNIAAERYGVEPAALLAAMRSCSRELWMNSQTIDYCREIGISAREGLWGTFEGDGSKLRELREWICEYRRLSWTNALQAVGVRDGALGDELVDRFLRDRRERHVVFPESAQLLADLRYSYRLGLITNGAVDIQMAKIVGSKLGEYFATTVISGAHGFGKPASAIFAMALKELGVEAGDAVMIGDNLSRDIAGARAVGMKTIWVNRIGRPRDSRYPDPDLEVRDLCSLKSILKVLD